MPAITVKNIPPDVYDKLQELARANRRSINSEVIHCIERAVSSRRLEVDELLTRARQLREQTASYAMSDEELTRAKQEGRL